MNAGTTQVIVGLGNPGSNYAGNRHNIGYMVLDELARRRELVYRTDVAGCLWTADAQCTLLRPATYMNRSGDALATWAARQDLALTGRPESEPDSPAPDDPPRPQLRPLVICDDLALPLGSVRLRARGSSGGQNGLESIIDHLGGEEFPRLRLGIAPPDAPVPPQDWPDFVLTDFTTGEAEVVNEIVNHAADAVEFWLENGLEATVSRYNRRIRPDRPSPP
jgi:PTH1 family peptidyl-tRNA hydrolase